jgi:RNA polymerase sigma factor (sigma-70 family)
VPGLPPFERVVRDHGPVVLRVCRAVVGVSDADDAWQETFLAALRAYPGLDAGTNLQAWLVTVAHHRCVDLLRARARRALPLAEVPEAGAGARAGPEHAAEDRELREAVAGLPERQRLAVALHHLGGLPYAEVAALVGGTSEAARRAAADGVAALRRAGGF